jgi:acyl dehydratase
MATSLKIGDLASRVGQEVGVSAWVEIAQERIDQFARATEDFQWIHIDQERAKQSPFGTTIAHGFLTLSLLPKLSDSAFELSDRKMGVNYGLNRLRFTSPVPAGSRVRGRFTLAKVEEIEGGVQTTWNVVVEREGGEKPVLVAETLSRHFY